MKMTRGTVVVITGAGSGIGRAIALECAHRGCTVAAIDRDQDRLRSLTEAAKPSAPFTTHHVDVGVAAEVNAVAADLQARWRHVHVLINCAGVSVAAPFSTLAPADFRWLMQTNFWGVVHMCQAFLPALQEAPEAVIANMLSPFAVLGFPTKTAYCAAKFAVRGFAEALRTELNGSRVAVTNVYPGAVATRLIQDGRVWDAVARRQESEFVARWGLSLTHVVSRTLRGIEQRRSRVRIGVMTRLIDWATRIAPVSTNTLLGRRRGHLSLVRGAAT